MKRFAWSRKLVSLAGSVSLVCVSVSIILPATAAFAGGRGWNNAIQITGGSGFNAGGSAQIVSISCTSLGNCSAGGYYEDSSYKQQSFVVNDVDGSWGAAEDVPGLAGLDLGGYDEIYSVSCAAPGYCSAVGSYTNSAEVSQVFVVDEKGGSWGDAEQIPGTDVPGNAEVFSVSCSAPGYCSAGGFDANTAGNGQGFVVDETNSVWGAAEAIPGMASLTSVGTSEIESISCASPGNCGAGGLYLASHTDYAFVVNEVGGTWGSAEEVAGTTPTSIPYAQVASISCKAPGECSAGGEFMDANHDWQPYVVDEVDGTWDTADQVPGVMSHSQFNGEVYSVSCSDPGDCSSVGGSYADSSGDSHTFVVNETADSWSTAEDVPGTANPAGYDNARVNSVSCAAPGDCTAGGYDYNGSQGAFVVDETGGIWGTAEDVPGTASSSSSSSGKVNSVSCTAPGDCTAGGEYGNYQNGGILAFVVDEGPGVVSNTAWSVSNNNVGQRSNYTWEFTTASSGEVSSLTFTVPAGTGIAAGGLSLETVFGLDAEGATVSVSSGTVSIVLGMPQQVAAGVPIFVQIDNFDNTASAGSYSSAVSTIDASEETIDTGSSSAVEFFASTTQVEVAVPDSASFANSAPNIYLTPIPAQGGEVTPAACGSGYSSSGLTYSDRATSPAPCDIVLDVSTNAGHGYTLTASLAGTTTNQLTGQSNANELLPNVPSDPGNDCSSTLPVDTFGASASLSSGASGAKLQQGWAGPNGSGGNYCGFATGAGTANSNPTEIVAATGMTAAAADVLTLAPAVSVDFAQPADIYGGTITYMLTPKYN